MSKQRTVLDEVQIQRCRDILEELIQLHKDTDPSLGKKSAKDKGKKSQLAIQKLGVIGGILTEWAEHQTFGIYYQMAKNKKEWMEDKECNSHEHELMWYDEYPDDLYSNEYQLACTRGAIGEIIHNSFSRTGLMGWRRMLAESLCALNDGQVKWLLDPINTKQQGDAYDIQKLKKAALLYLYKLLGEGWKKTAAIQRIAEYSGTTFEAVKKWEKVALKNQDFTPEELEFIKLGARFMFQSNDMQRSELVMMLLGMNKLTIEGSEEAVKVSAGALKIVVTEREIPIHTLKDRMREAGMRVSN